MTESGLPLHGVTDIQLPPEPAEAVAALQAALGPAGADPVELGARLRDTVATHPTFLDGWAHLAAWALDAGDTVSAYAFARTGYHRGLDRCRAAGWRGQGPVPWHHEANRGFLRSVHGLMRAAGAIGELDEAERCRRFLVELDPGDHLGVRSVDVTHLRA